MKESVSRYKLRLSLSSDAFAKLCLVCRKTDLTPDSVVSLVLSSLNTDHLFSAFRELGLEVLDDE